MSDFFPIDDVAEHRVNVNRCNRSNANESRQRVENVFLAKYFAFVVELLLQQQQKKKLKRSLCWEFEKRS
jgi:hypothetical protein